MKKPLPLTALYLGYLIALGTYLRLSQLSNFALSPDDCLHILISVTPFSQILHLNSFDTNAPLIYFLLHYWLKLFPLVSLASARIISLIPGILLIPTVYLLGKKFNSTASGIFAAVVITFSIGTLLLSQTIRQYALFLLLFSWTLIFWHDLNHFFSRKRLLIFSLLAFLTTATHYLSILPLFFIFLNSWHWPHKKIWTLAFVPTILFLLLSFISQGQTKWLYNSSPQIGATTGWLKQGYPHSLPDLLYQTKLIFSLFSTTQPVLLATVIVLFLGGLIIAIKNKSYSLLLICLGPWFINILFSLIKLYPYSGTRHILHLLLPVVLIMSLPFSLFPKINDNIHKLSSSLFFLCLIIFPAVMTYYVKTHNFYRSASLISPMEFVFPQSVLNSALSDLNHLILPGDLILTDRQTAMYLMLDSHQFNSNLLTQPVADFTYHQTPICFQNYWDEYFSLSHVNTLLSSCKYMDQKPSRIIIASVGWVSPYIRSWVTTPYLSSLIKTDNTLIQDGRGYVYYVLKTVPPQI